MHWYLVWCKKVNKAAMLLSVLCLAATVFLCFMQVTTRTAMQFSFRWTEEVTRYIVIFAVFLTSGTLLAENEHPRVEILTGLFSPKNQLRMHYFYDALILVFVVVLSYYGWLLAASSTKIYCSSIRIPWAVPFSAVFIGGLNMFIQIPAKFVKTHQAIVDIEQVKQEGERHE